MGRKSLPASLTLLAIVALCGCGSGSGSTGQKAPSSARKTKSARASSQGWIKGPINGTTAARRLPSSPGREPGIPSLPAAPCSPTAPGLATVYLLPDVPAPRCLRVTPSQRIRFVNRSGAFRQKPTAVAIRVGGYTARIAPNHAALFTAPVGAYLALGSHKVDVRGAPAPGLVVVAERCAGRGQIDPGCLSDQ